MVKLLASLLLLSAAALGPRQRCKPRCKPCGKRKAPKRPSFGVPLPALAYAAVMGAPIYGKDLIPGTGGMLDLDDFSPRSTPNEYMAAPADACARFTDDAKREASPIFPISVDELQREFEAMLRGRCAVPLYARPTLSDVAMRQFVYVERTPLFRFPDILNVRFLRLGDESSTLVLHSASVFGASDLGKNEQRVKEMIKSLSTLTDATMPVILNATQPVANLANATQTNATAAAV